MIDFTDCKRLVNNYDGADMKLRVEHDGQIYMLKFGQKLESNDRKPLQASYSSAPISEWLGCHVFAVAGRTFDMPVQETILGTFAGKTVVACKDFIAARAGSANLALLEFKKLENSYLGSSTAGGRTPLYENLMGVFQNHPSLAPVREEALERYWQTFAIDALIGNFDRHAGNWGYIYSPTEDRIVGLAPVYDCGSSFYPQLNETAMQDFVKDRKALEERVKTFPTAALRFDKKKVGYHEFLLSEQGAPARATAAKVMASTDFQEINELIERIPCISTVKREFYRMLIDVRKETILRPACELYEKETDGISLGNASREMLAASRELDARNQHLSPSPAKETLR